VPQELHDLSADLELTEVAVQVDAIQAVQVELHVPVEHIVDRDRIDPNQTCRHHDLPQPACREPKHAPGGR
jgi:hypothetical protein